MLGARQRALHLFLWTLKVLEPEAKGSELCLRLTLTVRFVKVYVTSPKTSKCLWSRYLYKGQGRAWRQSPQCWLYRACGRTAGLSAEERGLLGSDAAFVSDNQLPADLEPGWEFPPLCLSTLTALRGDLAQLPPEPTPEPVPWSSCDMEKAAQKLRQKCDHRRKRTSASLL